MPGRTFYTALALAIVALSTTRAGAAIPVDQSGYDPTCGVVVRHEGERIAVSWPMEADSTGNLTLDLRPDAPRIERIAVGSATLARSVDAATFLTVGSRVAPPARPPTMSEFNVFFDAPAKRPHQTYRSNLDLKHVRVASKGRRATIALGDLSMGPFAGELRLTFYVGARLVHVESVVKTAEDNRAILYDAGLVGKDSAGWERIAWVSTEGARQSRAVNADDPSRPIAVRFRSIVAEGRDGSIACFPPPHQFFFPRDITDNQMTVWSGRDHHGLEARFGIGVRQSETGGGAFVPWYNAPPGTEQHLGFFLLLTQGDADEALRLTQRYTNGDSFRDLPGTLKFTSHWHNAITMAALKAKAEGKPETIPDFVRMFKAMNVDIVHLAEFHGDGHPRDPGPLRLPEIEAMFAECERVSDDELLVLPGEEANVYLGVPKPGQHGGHWLYFFPKPVAWIMNREASQPFVEPHPRWGSLYRVGNRKEMLDLLEREHGLAWTAHPRIKASSWTPDAYRDEDFFRSDRWLGAAWKAMPADLSRDRLGERALDLLDDMANWGVKKYAPGEVDVFKIDHTHELYGHINVNYLSLERLPRYQDGWQPVLDCLRNGRFFVTTGEVLIPRCTLDDSSSGETLRVTNGRESELIVDLEWTFPLDFAEIVMGDGSGVERKRIDLSGTLPFERSTQRINVDLKGKRWLRFEVWDIARNGAFTQPIWIEGP